MHGVKEFSPLFKALLTCLVIAPSRKFTYESNAFVLFIWEIQMKTNVLFFNHIIKVLKRCGILICGYLCSLSPSGTIYVMLQTLISSIVFHSIEQQPEHRMYIKWFKGYKYSCLTFQSGVHAWLQRSALMDINRIIESCKFLVPSVFLVSASTCK